MRLEIKNVGKHFGGVQALHNVSLVVDKPELMGLIGPNGAGKTTLTNILDGAYKPSSGEVWLNDERIDGMPPYKIARRGLGRTFQVTRAFLRMTVMENMLVPGMALHAASKKKRLEERNYHSLWWMQYGYLQQGKYEKALELINGE